MGLRVTVSTGDQFRVDLVHLSGLLTPHLLVLTTDYRGFLTHQFPTHVGVDLAKNERPGAFAD